MDERPLPERTTKAMESLADGLHRLVNGMEKIGGNGTLSIAQALNRDELAHEFKKFRESFEDRDLNPQPGRQAFVRQAAVQFSAAMLLTAQMPVTEPVAAISDYAIRLADNIWLQTGSIGES